MSSMASDPYLSSFYAGSYHYQGFGVGDGTWSNGGGDHMTFLGSYGGQIAPGTEQAGYSADLGPATMFSAGGGFGAFTQPAAGYGFDFHTASGGTLRAGRGTPTIALSSPTTPSRTAETGASRPPSRQCKDLVSQGRSRRTVQVWGVESQTRTELRPFTIRIQ